AEAIICIKAIETGIIPPTINTEVIDPQMPTGFKLVVGEKIRKDIKVAMSNTFGFGGHNATVVMKRVD
ncbi:MAG: beta-ketoacyl-[acyl-carrier-protein] synthase II, partial [Cyclobacteriaceae bacterium]